MVTVAERARSLLGDKTEAYGADPSNPKHYEFRYKVIELSDLVTSHDDNFMPNPDYPKELQPRLRDRAASQVQIGSMAKNLNPRVLLHDSGFLDTGPVIAGPDNVLESGNGRVMALRLAATEHRDKYDLYLDMLKTNAGKYGLDPREISEMKQPVLIRERLTEVDRTAFAAEANVGAVMRMSPYEQALQDSTRLSDHVIGNLVIGEDQSIDQALRSPKNKAVVQHFAGTLPANERAGISEAGGTINQQGLDRLKLAIFAKTYTGSAGQRLVRIFGENVDPYIKGIENAAFQSLPDMAKAESLIGAGHRDKKLSITEDLAEVIDAYASLKQQHLKVSDYLAQSAMFEERLTLFQKDLLRHLDDIGHKPKYVREFLREVAQGILDAPPPGQTTFMGIEARTKEGVANAIITKQRKWLGLAEIELTASAAPGKGLEEPHELRVESVGKPREEVRQEARGPGPLPKEEPADARVDVTLAAPKEPKKNGKRRPGEVTAAPREPKKNGKRRPREVTTAAQVAKVQAARSDKAQTIDLALLSSRVVRVDDAAPWLKHPNRYDIAGVDAPKGTKTTVRRTPTPRSPTKRKSKGPGLMLTSGKLVRQKRGSVI